jgi:hypothetical protein
MRSGAGAKRAWHPEKGGYYMIKKLLIFKILTKPA